MTYKCARYDQHCVVCIPKKIMLPKEDMLNFSSFPKEQVEFIWNTSVAKTPKCTIGQISETCRTALLSSASRPVSPVFVNLLFDPF